MCRRHGPASRATWGDRRRPRQRRALQAMAPGRPATRGGQGSTTTSVCGGRLGMVGGLQRWTRARRDPPPGHDLVAGGGLAAADTGRSARHACLVHVTPLAVICRATCRAPRHTTARCPRVDASVWHQDGVVPGAPVGTGHDACTISSP